MDVFKKKYPFLIETKNIYKFNIAAYLKKFFFYNIDSYNTIKCYIG